MSIATRTGDTGSTGLMYNRRVPKTHPQVEACGAVDELNAALGLARTMVTDPVRLEFLVTVQRHLIGLMGELATAPEDFARYRSDGYATLSEGDLALLDAWVGQL